MENLKESINNKLKLLEKLIDENSDIEKIESVRNELDKLLNMYMKDFN